MPGICTPSHGSACELPRVKWLQRFSSKGDAHWRTGNNLGPLHSVLHKLFTLHESYTAGGAIYVRFGGIARTPAALRNVSVEYVVDAN
jgi:hypothetical protein